MKNIKKFSTLTEYEATLPIVEDTVSYVEEDDSIHLDRIQKPTIFEVEITNLDEGVFIPIMGLFSNYDFSGYCFKNLDITVDWGDGVIENIISLKGNNYDSNWVYHLYTNLGTYQVKITGYIPAIIARSSMNRTVDGNLKYFRTSYIKKIVQWGTDKGLIYFSNPFLDLVNIADDTDQFFRSLLTMVGKFKDITTLENIPNIFTYLTAPNSWDNLFSGCINVSGSAPLIDNTFVWDWANLYKYGNVGGTSCLAGCVNMTDYNRAPDSWKS